MNQNNVYYRMEQIDYRELKYDILLNNKYNFLFGSGKSRD